MNPEVYPNAQSFTGNETVAEELEEADEEMKEDTYTTILSETPSTATAEAPEITDAQPNTQSQDLSLSPLYSDGHFQSSCKLYLREEATFIASDYKPNQEETKTKGVSKASKGIKKPIKASAKKVQVDPKLVQIKSSVKELYARDLQSKSIFRATARTFKKFI